MDLRLTARNLFTTTLQQLSIPNAMQLRVMRQNEKLLIGGHTYELRNFRRIVVIAIGKAAVPMCDALLLQIQPAPSSHQTLEGIIVGPSTPTAPPAHFQFFQGEHPIPGPNSQLAAQAILTMLSFCDPHCLVFFLISGGASAMVEEPLDPRFPLEQVAAFHQALVHSGLPITTMNTLRKHFSRVKGGRLAVAAQHAAQCTLLISDVPGYALHTVGSGPSLPDPSTIRDCRQIIQAHAASLALSTVVRRYFDSPQLEETPKPHHPAFAQSHLVSLLSSDDLCTLAAQAARAHGFHVEIDNRCDDWDYREAARHLLQHLHQLRRNHPRVCLLSAGEVSVQLPPNHGTGGRNQQFVLECARLLVENDIHATVLSAGSDGSDGNSSAAGAVCDETTFARTAARGLDAAAALEHFNSTPLFFVLGDAIVTGPTGNNVRDLRIFLSEL
ncbi:MAG: DUF4147 domain-containing protein [Acidobacteriota bacterium]|nr:DUF4147 domain-containing protein [Acidobacteriota bacterium]